MCRRKYVDHIELSRWVSSARLRFPSAGAWLVGHEPNVPPEQDFQSARLRILIVRLTSYYTVSSSMSHSLLGQISISVPGVYVDYCFMPPPEEASAFLRDGIPPLFGTTSKRIFNDFNLIAISNSVAQELVNLPWLLINSGIPLDRESRMGNSGIPLMIMGGANAQSAFIACPSPQVSPFSLADALYFGEAEQEWPKVLAYLRDSELGLTVKEAVLKELSERFCSVYVPTVEGTPRRRAGVKDLDSVSSLIKAPLWYNEETVGHGSIAIDGGCAFLCAFCKEAWESRPYRIRSVENVVRQCREARRYQGLDTINLFSFNATSHPGLHDILSGVRCSNLIPQIKSQRFDLLLRNPETLNYQQISGKTHYTFGLEGISERLRAFLSKDIEEWQALEALEMVLSGHVRGIKLFLIITGYEEERDWREFDSFLFKVKSLRERHRRGRGEGLPVVLSFTPLISMPHTPLQFSAFPEMSRIRDAFSQLKEIGRRASMTVRESISPEEARCAQMMLFSGGQAAQPLQRMSEFGFYQHSLSEKAAQFLMNSLPSEWMRETLGQKDPSTVFPWDILMTVEEKERLYALYRKCCSSLGPGRPGTSKASLSDSQAGASRASGSDSQVLTLRAAGSDSQARTLRAAGSDSQARTLRAAGSDSQVRTLRAAGLDSQVRTSQGGISHKPVMRWFKAFISPQCAGLPVRYFQTSTARMLCLSDDTLSSMYLRPGPAFADLERIPTSGIRIFSLLFSDNPEQQLIESSLQKHKQWQWQVISQRESAACEKPSGVLLGMPCPCDEMENRVRSLSQWLGSEKIGHHLERGRETAVFQIARPSVKKAGCLYVRFNSDEAAVEVAALTSSPCLLLLSGMKGKTRGPSPVSLWYEQGEKFAPSVLAWYYQQSGRRCGHCKAPLPVDAFDGSPLRDGICQLCGR
ncbi:MAG: radical SAM protein [Candidatus Xenobiia bacterium LiM19]